MKKLWKAVIYSSIIIAALLVAVSGFAFVYHEYRLDKESALYENKGTMVDINGKKINVYTEGKGSDTYVFMAGAGIAAPVYEMKGLYSKFSKGNKIAVVERGGYGYSDEFGDGRDLDTILEQTRESLLKSGNQPPYILVPHSLSGLESIYWAQKYPDEVKGIIALDIGLPEEYVDYPMGKADLLTIRAMNVLTKLGFQRFVPSAIYDPEVIEQSFLTEQEKESYKAISYKQMFNKDMADEMLNNYKNAKKSTGLALPNETPILFISAYTKENKDNKYTKQKNDRYRKYAVQLDLSTVKEVEGKHSIYLYAPDEIYNHAIGFIEKVNDGRDVE